MGESFLNYNEQLYQAIDVIVNERLNSLAYDQTIVGEIVDDSQAYNGIYTIKSGLTTFVAYSDKTDYKYGQNVNILIPQGDYNAKKLIISANLIEKKLDYKFTPEKEKIYRCSKNLLQDQINKPITIDLNTSLNHIGEMSTKLIAQDIIINASDNKNYNKFIEPDVLIFKAQFQFNNQNQKILSGNYGVLIEVITAEGVIPITFDTIDMVGNTYYGKADQEATIKISNISFIQKINLYLYQKNNFFYLNPQEDKKEYYDIQNDPLSVTATWFALLVGIDTDTYKETSQLQLVHTTDDCWNYEQYINNYNQLNTTPTGLLWLHQDKKDGHYLGFEDGIVDNDYDEFTYQEQLKEWDALKSLNNAIFKEKKIPSSKVLLTSYNQISKINAKLYNIMTQFSSVLFPTISTLYNTAYSYLEGDTISKYDRLFAYDNLCYCAPQSLEDTLKEKTNQTLTVESTNYYTSISSGFLQLLNYYLSNNNNLALIKQIWTDSFIQNVKIAITDITKWENDYYKNYIKQLCQSLYYCPETANSNIYFLAYYNIVNNREIGKIIKDEEQEIIQNRGIYYLYQWLLNKLDELISEMQKDIKNKKIPNKNILTVFSEKDNDMTIALPTGNQSYYNNLFPDCSTKEKRKNGNTFMSTNPWSLTRTVKNKINCVKIVEKEEKIKQLNDDNEEEEISIFSFDSADYVESMKQGDKTIINEYYTSDEGYENYLINLANNFELMRSYWLSLSDTKTEDETKSQKEKSVTPPEKGKEADPEYEIWVGYINNYNDTITEFLKYLKTGYLTWENTLKLLQKDAQNSTNTASLQIYQNSKEEIKDNFQFIFEQTYPAFVNAGSDTVDINKFEKASAAEIYNIFTNIEAINYNGLIVRTSFQADYDNFIESNKNKYALYYFWRFNGIASPVGDPATDKNWYDNGSAQSPINMFNLNVAKVNNKQYEKYGIKNQQYGPLNMVFHSANNIATRPDYDWAYSNWKTNYKKTNPNKDIPTLYSIELCAVLYYNHEQYTSNVLSWMKNGAKREYMTDKNTEPMKKFINTLENAIAELNMTALSSDIVPINLTLAFDNKKGNLTIKPNNSISEFNGYYPNGITPYVEIGGVRYEVKGLTQKDNVVQLRDQNNSKEYSWKTLV